jgi:hypothetical protein
MSALYEQAVSGKDMVCAMFRRRGVASAAFVQFWDSRDVYDLNWTDPESPTLTLLMTADTAVSGTEHEPRLRADYNHYRAGDHKTLGYVYMFSLATPQGDVFVMIDGNRNGVIDDWLTLSRSAFFQPPYELGSAASFNEDRGLVY